MSQQKSGAAVGTTVGDSFPEDVDRRLPQEPSRTSSSATRCSCARSSCRTARGGSAISLVERQVSMLRQRNGQLERQFKDLVAVAQAERRAGREDSQARPEAHARCRTCRGAWSASRRACARISPRGARCARAVRRDRARRTRSATGFVRRLPQDDVPDPAVRDVLRGARRAAARCATGRRTCSSATPSR